MSQTNRRLLHWLAVGLISSLASMTFIPLAQADTAPIQITNLAISEIANPADSAQPSVHLVTLSGSYTNSSANSLGDVELDLIASGPIRTRGELDDLIANPHVTTGKVQAGYSAKLRNVKPGQNRNWQVSFIGEDVLGPTSSGVFALGVLPNQKQNGIGTVTTTPWFYGATVQPTQAVLAVQLATLDTHLANNEVSDPKFDVAEVNRLNRLLTASENKNVSWLLDPALPIWASNLTSQLPSDEVTQLNSKLQTLPASTALLPFGHSDLAALLRANRDDEAALTVATTQGLASERNIYYAPVSGSADRTSVGQLNDLGVQTIISNAAVRGTDNITVPARITASTNPVLVFDAGVSKCLTTATTSESNFAQLTCLRSELGMITAESPQQSRAILILAPARWAISSDNLNSLLNAITGQPWVAMSQIGSLVPSQNSESVIAQPDNEQRNLSRSLLKQADLLALNTESVAALFDDQELAASFTSKRLLGYSDLFKSNAAATSYLNSNYELLNKYLTSIQLEASERITTPATESEIPITIVNDSDKSVSVSINVTSNSKSRFQAQPTGIINVDSGQRVTVPVQVSLVGAGIVNVQAQLVAPNGEQFGEVQNIQISSAAYGSFARTLVWGAFALLILLALSNFLKRRKIRQPKA